MSPRRHAKRATSSVISDDGGGQDVIHHRSEPRVASWLESLTDDVAITTITLAELPAAVRRLPAGRRRTGLETAIDDALEPYRGTRIRFSTSMMLPLRRMPRYSSSVSGPERRSAWRMRRSPRSVGRTARSARRGTRTTSATQESSSSTRGMRETAFCYDRRHALPPSERNGVPVQRLIS